MMRLEEDACVIKTSILNNLENRKECLMLYVIKDHFILSEVQNPQGRCVTLYLPTHRYLNQKKEDRITFKNLIKELEAKLDLKDFERQNQVLHNILEDDELWEHSQDGMAVLSCDNYCYVYRFPHAVPTMSKVEDDFYLRPLLYVEQQTIDFHVLGLNLDHFELFRYHQNRLTKIDLSEADTLNRRAVLGQQHTEDYFTESSFAGVGRPAIHTSNTDKRKDFDVDTHKYFRFIDHYVQDKFSNPMKQPLVLMSTQTNISDFCEVSHNPYLYKHSIDLGYQNVSIKTIEEEVSKIAKMIVEENNQNRIRIYKQAQVQNHSLIDLYNIYESCLEGKIDTLMIKKDSHIYVKMHENSRKFKLSHSEDKQAVELIDLMVKQVLTQQGKIWILPKNTELIEDIACILKYSK